MTHMDFDKSFNEAPEAQYVIEPTCRMCDGDTFNSSDAACCSECASLLATDAGEADEKLAYRTKLVRIARRAMTLQENAYSLFIERACSHKPSQSCIDEARGVSDHRYDRYARLEQVLATDTGLTINEIANGLGGWKPERLFANVAGVTA